jgi:hypothetical protein
MQSKPSKDKQTPAPNGVDLWMIRDNLRLSLEDRVAQHQNTLDFIDKLKQASQKARAKSSDPAQITDP